MKPQFTHSDTMQALAITSYDGPMAMRVVDRPIPEPGAGEVSIEVSHAGIGFIDGLFATGFGAVGLPFVPGLEVAGIVRALGDGVHGLAVGQQVAALTITTSGGYAQVVVAQAALVAPLPTGMDAGIAAATCTNTVTAVSGLKRVGDLTGRAVLVHAGVGGVGSQFGQVARALGAARVAAVVGTAEKAVAARDLGYDEVFRRDTAERPSAGWDLIIDPVGGRATSDSMGLLAPFGTLLRVGNASGADAVAIDSMQLWLNGTTAAGFNLGAFTAAHPHQVGTDLSTALGMVATGKVAVTITETTSLSEAPQAVNRVLTGTTIGKAVIAL